MRPIILLVLLAVLLVPLARADTITTAFPAELDTSTTTATVTVQIGCWNPAICGDPAAYWDALGLPVPVIEPPAADFAPYGDPPLFIFTYDAANGDMIATRIDPVTTPEPSTALLISVGLLALASIAGSKRRMIVDVALFFALPVVANELPSIKTRLE